jgi:UDP-N-acetylmuramoylalanine--D-glutamate ligase
MPTKESLLSGQHHDQNSLAALSMASLIGLPLSSCWDTLRSFSGVPHRCAYVDTVGGVLFYNDSKATNIGAVIAALATLSEQHPEAGCWIILGGDAKAADLSGLLPSLRPHVKHALLIGRDADRFAALCAGVLPHTKCDSLTDAVGFAYERAAAGDVVLLSPACASLDAFESYAHRGTVFAEAVKALALSAKS